MPTDSLTDSPISIADRYGLRRFSVAEYHRLGEVGVLSEDDRVELIDGFILTKMIHSPLHDATISIVEGVLRTLLTDSHILRIQSAITATGSEPEPDIAIVLGPPERYLHQHPQGEQIRLIVEVAESSLERDRLKAAIYAAERIPEYWIINLREQTLEVHKSPESERYELIRILTRNDVAELTLPTGAIQPIPIANLFPS